MSVRTLVVALALLAFAVGGWQLVAPKAEATRDEAADDISAVLATTGQAAFTGASASLEIHRRTTGSYAGARLAAGMTLVRADASSYCVQTQVGAAVQHLAGPGGSPVAGAC
jgi:TRAP-type C4-dicarboxylate transport system permease small subunit